MKNKIWNWVLLMVMGALLLQPSLSSEEAGATFLFRLNDMLGQIDPNQKLQDDLMESRLRTLLGRAQKLRREHHLARQKGLKGSQKLKSLEQEGEKLIHEVLDMTESYLEGRLKSLKENRKQLVEALKPKGDKG
jgi:hypothetical protein